MTPNRLTYITKSVSLTVGVLLFHLYKNKKDRTYCPVLCYVKIVKLFTTN